MHKNILFLLTGSISCYKACAAISKLVQAGNEVQTIATPSALRFVGKATLEGLTHRPVHSDMWENATGINHVALGKWADIALLCPASANTISRLAHGIADDVIGTTYLAWPLEKPWWIFPAMNSAMLAHPATQSSLKILAERGAKILGSGIGQLACGDTGAGRLLEPEQIADAVLAALK